MFAVINTANSRRIPTTEVKVNNKVVSMMVDTGASVNIIDTSTYEHIGKPTLSKKDIKLYAYGQMTELPVQGHFKGEIERQGVRINESFYVV